jgi:hypothetical protein
VEPVQIESATIRGFLRGVTSMHLSSYQLGWKGFVLEKHEAITHFAANISASVDPRCGRGRWRSRLSALLLESLFSLLVVLDIGHRDVPTHEASLLISQGGYIAIAPGHLPAMRICPSPSDSISVSIRAYSGKHYSSFI